MVAAMNVGIVDPTGVNQQQVDPLWLAARIALRPLDYTGQGAVLGHYSVAQQSGDIAATLGAAAHVARIRWTDPTRYCVLLGIRVGWTVTAAVTVAVPMDMRAIIARGFSVDFTTNMTAISLAGVVNTNKMRASMGASLMGVNGPGICTTAAMSGQTLTADAAPFAVTNWANQASGNAIVTQAVGVSGALQELYSLKSSDYEHPVVLTNNEGVILQPLMAGPASGTFRYYAEWKWAECVVF